MCRTCGNCIHFVPAEGAEGKAGGTGFCIMRDFLMYDLLPEMFLGVQEKDKACRGWICKKKSIPPAAD